MGISGLLPVLKSITETKTIDQYRGQTLAIDGYCWLHRAIYCCSQEICLNEETDKYVVYFIDRVHALLQHGVKPYVVFDGGPLPMKRGTEEERRKSRAKNRELGIESLRQKNYADARKYFVRAADVSPYMAHCVIQRLKAMNVQYVVAPYEADAQLAFLSQHGLVDGVITEDSDCLPFGCAKVLFKMDRDGIAQEVRASNLKRNAGLSFHMFTHEMFLEMCIFSGCDYLSSLPGFGLKKAYALMKQHGSCIKILRALRMEGKVRIPPTYEAEFERALLTFRHQRVYDPTVKKLVPLTPIPQELLDQDPKMDFLGPAIADETAQAIAEGDMDPISFAVFTVRPAPARPHTGNSANANYAPSRRTNGSSGFITREQPTPVRSVQPQPQRAPNRSLPAWMSRKASQLTATAQASSSASLSPPSRSPPAAASTPKTISHFFATRANKLSPTDDATKSVSGSSALTGAPVLSRQQSTESSTYESQDPSEVDVARIISFSPLDDDAKQIHDKENAAPNSTETNSPPENAFARMMRAGTAFQKHSLKRKAPHMSSSSAALGSTRLSAGVVGRHLYKHETPMERIKRLAFNAPSTPSDANKSVSSHSSSPATPAPASNQSPEPEEEQEPEVVESLSQIERKDDSPPDGADVVVRSSILRERLLVKKAEQHDVQARILPPKPVDAFARFRFGK